MSAAQGDQPGTGEQTPPIGRLRAAVAASLDDDHATALRLLRSVLGPESRADLTPHAGEVADLLRVLATARQTSTAARMLREALRPPRGAAEGIDTAAPLHEQADAAREALAAWTTARLADAPIEALYASEGRVVRLREGASGTTIADVAIPTLAVEDVTVLRRRARAGEPYAVLARELGVTFQAVWQAARGVTWRDHPEPVASARR